MLALEEVRRLLAGAPSIRDRLLLGLLYGFAAFAVHCLEVGMSERALQQAMGLFLAAVGFRPPG